MTNVNANINRSFVIRGEPAYVSESTYALISDIDQVIFGVSVNQGDLFFSEGRHFSLNTDGELIVNATNSDDVEVDNDTGELLLTYIP